jgi:hypothetical protein
MVLKEKSGYLRIEVLSKNFFQEVKNSLEQLKKERLYEIPMRERIRLKAEELWKENPNNGDLDNWLLAEKQIQEEENVKFRKIRLQQQEISRCLRKYYIR